MSDEEWGKLAAYFNALMAAQAILKKKRLTPDLRREGEGDKDSQGAASGSRSEPAF